MYINKFGWHTCPHKLTMQKKLTCIICKNMFVCILFWTIYIYFRTTRTNLSLCDHLFLPEISRKPNQPCDTSDTARLQSVHVLSKCWIILIKLNQFHSSPMSWNTFSLWARYIKLDEIEKRFPLGMDMQNLVVVVFMFTFTHM